MAEISTKTTKRRQKSLKIVPVNNSDNMVNTNEVAGNMHENGMHTYYVAWQ